MQELLTTFADELEGGELALCPGKGGVFEISADGELIAAAGSVALQSAIK